jgi:hypothetical protein
MQLDSQHRKSEKAEDKRIFFPAGGYVCKRLHRAWQNFSLPFHASLPLSPAADGAIALY